MKRPLHLAAVLLLVYGLAGCANFTGNLLGQPTPYQPFNGSIWGPAKYGGYSETKLGADVYRVSFTGDTYTPPVVATDYALLRSADVALGQGFPYFAIVNGADVVQVGQVTTPSTTSTTYETRGNTLYEVKTTRPGTTYTTATPSSSNTVVLYKNRPANSKVLIYDAREIYSQLTKKYGVKPTH